jgi:hypothetical protein
MLRMRQTHDLVIDELSGVYAKLHVCARSPVT